MKFTLTLLTAFILFSTNSIAQRSEKEAYHIADSLFWVIQKDTNKFCEMIQLYSQDPASKEICGYYDWADGDIYVPQIRDYVRRNQFYRGVSQPIKTDFGYHLVQALGTRNKEIRFKHLLINVKQ